MTALYSHVTKILTTRRGVLHPHHALVLCGIQGDETEPKGGGQTSAADIQQDWCSDAMQVLNVQGATGLEVKTHAGVVELGVGEAVGHALLVFDPKANAAALDMKAAKVACVTVIVRAEFSTLKSHRSV